MDRSWTELHGLRHREPTRAAAWTMNMKLSPGWSYGGLIVVLAGWMSVGNS
jgi:hypothetical protein